MRNECDYRLFLIIGFGGDVINATAQANRKISVFMLVFLCGLAHAVMRP